jgi:hypothetical protein
MTDITLAGAAIADIASEVPEDDLLALVCRIASTAAELLEEMLPHDYEPYWGRLDVLLEEVVTRAAAGELTIGVYSSVSGSAGGNDDWHRYTWKELARSADEKRAALGAWQTICQDLDRCEHGRHEDDVCDGCGGYSKGNPLLGENRAIGFSLDGIPIAVPPRARKGDPNEWGRRRGR